MNDAQINRLVSELREMYSPLVSLKVAAEIAQAPMATLYDWSSRGLLDGFRTRRGRRVLLDLDGYVRFLFREPS